ncbi:MAG TPA: VOC family protein [Burkholderiales bacterium]|nr:VOC family protein [Burkholderiales bacterium]
MSIQRIHHVAYRCRDAAETVRFYHGLLGMKYTMAISEDRVPSTKEPDPYMHIFFDAGRGSSLAFFELPNSPAMGRDANTPAWVQHIAFEVKDRKELLARRRRLRRRGIEVVGPTDHQFIESIYFFDPNGHRVELTVRKGGPALLRKLSRLAPRMLRDWTRGKRTVRHAAFLHRKEFLDPERAKP